MQSNILSEPHCCDGWESLESEVNGECPECGMPTVEKSMTGK